MSEAVIRRNVPADPACELGLVDLLVHEVRESFRIDLSTRQAGQDLTSQHLTQNATLLHSQPRRHLRPQRGQLAVRDSLPREAVIDVHHRPSSGLNPSCAPHTGHQSNVERGRILEHRRVPHIFDDY